MARAVPAPCRVPMRFSDTERNPSLFCAVLRCIGGTPASFQALSILSAMFGVIGTIIVASICRHLSLQGDMYLPIR
eukprot:7930343-Lingulodinium_polyedra.AAC.1